MNVVLVGYRGTGKSSVAAFVGRALGWPVVSLDDEIEREAGQSIPQIVRERGWPGFRELEEQLCRRFAANDSQVLDCGGGVVEREANFEALGKAGPVIWLSAAPETIVARIEGDQRRPSLTGTQSFTDEVAEVLARRTPLYQRIARYTVNTDGRSIEEIGTQVLTLIDSIVRATTRS
ncbi:MAG: shikimate kinase [Polyangiaceae bacterium]|nr:shikimate kinase [Polyangiaceae bacterium]